MLEQQHSHQRVTQEISKGCYKHCKALTIYISLIFIKVIMLGPDGVCVCVRKTFTWDWKYRKYTKWQRALCIPWKTVLCFLKRDSCFSPHRNWIKEHFFNPFGGLGHQQVPQDIDLSRMQTNHPTYQRRMLAGHSKLCCPCTLLYGHLSAGILVNSSTRTLSQSRPHLNTWSPRWSAWTGWGSAFLE